MTKDRHRQIYRMQKFPLAQVLMVPTHAYLALLILRLQYGVLWKGMWGVPVGIQIWNVPHRLILKAWAHLPLLL